MPASDQRLHIGEFEFEFGNARHRNAVLVLQQQLLELDRPLQRQHRRAIDRLREAQLDLAGEQGRGQAECGLERRVSDPGREIELVQHDIEHGLLRFSKGLETGVHLQRIAIERGRQARFDEHVNLHRQVRHEGQAQFEIDHFVRQRARLVIDLNATTADANVAHRKQRTTPVRLRGRLLLLGSPCRDALDNVAPAMASVLVDHHVQARPDQAHFMHHDTALQHGFDQLDIGAQRIESEGLGLCVGGKHLEPAHLHREREWVELDGTDLDRPAQRFTQNLHGVMHGNRRHDKETKRSDHDHSTRGPQRRTNKTPFSGRRVRAGGGIGHRALQQTDILGLVISSRAAAMQGGAGILMKIAASQHGAYSAPLSLSQVLTWRTQPLRLRQPPRGTTMC